MRHGVGMRTMLHDGRDDDVGDGDGDNEGGGAMVMLEMGRKSM